MGEMNSAKTQNPIIYDQALEQNIYRNAPYLNKRKEQKNGDGKKEKNGNVERSQSPYSHLIHPYLRNKMEQKMNHHQNNQNEQEIPNKINNLNLKEFKMNNSQNESVEDWRHSIESQLNKARSHSTEIEELCMRIKSISGLGRDVLIAQLRKKVNQQTFAQICHSLNFQ